MAVTAIYDANVLYPMHLRSLLVQLAFRRLVRGRWTEEIHGEWINGVLRQRNDLSREKLRAAADLMNARVPDSIVTGYEALIPTLVMSDPKDRHVLAAAIRARADVIVTKDLRHFPRDQLSLYGIEAQHPDAFVLGVLDLDPTAISAVQECRTRLTRPAMTVDDYLETLARQDLPETVAFLRERKGDL